MKYSRKEIRDRLRNTLDAGLPVIAAGADIGLSAKFAEGAARTSLSFTIPGDTE